MTTLEGPWTTATWRGFLRGTRVPVGGHWAAQQFSGSGVDPINDDDVLTVDELKERSHILESDALMKSYISAARQQVERDTGCALPTQTIAVTYDRLDPSGVYFVPMPPMQQLVSLQYASTDGTVTQLPVDETTFQTIDGLSMPGRFTFMPDVFAALGPPIPQAPLMLNVLTGWPKDLLPPLLKFAVGLLASHYLSFGRDLATLDSVTQMPMGYEAAIAPYRLETLV